MEDLLNKTTDNRNYGIDFLKILSMFFIVILHSLGHGGLLNHVSASSIQYKFVWIIEIIAYCAVDIFGLISGYVSYTKEEKKVKISNFMKLWMQVVFYSLSITIIFYIFKKNSVLKGDFVSAITPISNNLYWYFTAYAGLFVFMPFINKAIRNSDNIFLRKLFYIIILVFSIFDTKYKRFGLSNGYSFAWLLILYVLGAIIKKCDIGKDCKAWETVLFIFALYLITYLNKIFKFKYQGILLSYTSPTVLGVAIMYLIGFSKIKFNNIPKKIIKFGVVSSFTIYLINDNPIFRKYIIKGLFAVMANRTTIEIIIVILGFALSFVILSILVDKIRLFLFIIFHIEILINKFSAMISTLYNRVLHIESN